MSRVNLNQSPYYDDTNMEKQYYQLLAIPGRVAQAREITSMQTVLREIIKSVGDSILKNGDIIEGCQVIVNKERGTVSITEGKIYVEGITMPLKESTVSIEGVGTEIIGVKLVEEIIDENRDNSLRDPAQGYDNFNQPGCARLKRDLQVVVNDPAAATIATLVEGDVMVENYAPEYDTLTQTLARRTYDESGSYIVEGLKVRAEAIEGSNTHYNVVVEPGKAYILGYELKIPTARRIRASKSNTYTSVTRSRVRYVGTPAYRLESEPYVRAITSVLGETFGEVSANAPSHNTAGVQLLTRNADGSNEVTNIKSVTQGGASNPIKIGVYDSNTGKVDPEDSDCYLTYQGNTAWLYWNGTDNFPTGSYRIGYEYTKKFVEGIDYELTIGGDNGHYLTWKSGGSTPLLESNYSVSYEQYLARKDIVYMDKYGNITLVEGNPAEYGFEMLPEAPLNTLTLSHVMNTPNGSVNARTPEESITVSNVGLTRFTMNDIQNLLNRVQTIEYDQAVLSLNDDARQTDTALDKKGIFTDPLIDLSRIDFTYNLSSEGTPVDPSLPVYDMALDLACNICYLPVISNTHEVVYDTASSTAGRYNRLVSLAKTGERVILSQGSATKSFQINPYSVFPKLPEVSIDPAIDAWIEETIIHVPRSITDSSVVSLSTRTISTSQVRGGSFSRYTVSSSSVRDTAIGTRTETYTSDSVVEERAITYIRQREITVEGNNFPENLSMIKCYFDGIRVPLTPLGTTASDGAGGVNANSSGYFKAKFTIPSGVLTGTREVLLKSEVPIDGMVTEGFALYIAQGTARKIERTVTTVTTVLLERTVTTTNTTYIDPVGQTFVLDSMTLLKGIDLYFEAKPDINTPVTCEIRGVSNGTINSTVYASKTLRPTEVRTSTDATAVTRFNFDDPVLIEENKEYAFVVRSTSDSYRIWVAELGGEDVRTKDLVLKNPYMTGVMLSSSNNATWTAHQTTDIKFQLIADDYAQTSTMVFNSIPLTEAARLYLTADSAVPSGTSIEWSYSVDGSAYKSITPYNITLLAGLSSRVELRAILSREANSRLSPLVALDTLSLIESHYETSGCYVSSNVNNLDPYTTVKIIVDLYEPGGNAFTARVVTDKTDTPVLATRRTDITPLNYNWQEVTYEATVPADSTQFRLLLEATGAKDQTPAFRRLRCIMS